MNDTHHDALTNKLLAALPPDHVSLLTPHLTIATVTQNTVLLEAGEQADQIYFPLNGMLSLRVVMRDGKTIETATVGREGAVGSMAGPGTHRSLVRVVAQLPLIVARTSMAQFRRVAAMSDPLRQMYLQFNELLLAQARITAGCNALHPVESRLVRWLLQTADRAGGDVVALTHEMLADMLGVRRTSVTEVAGRLQAKRMISYSRGLIRILDRPALERTTCECYHTLVDHAARLS